MSFRGKSLKTLYLLPFLVLLTCGEDLETVDALLSESEASSSQTVIGRAKNTFDVQAATEQTFTYNEQISGNENSPISGSYIIFPAGSIVSEESDLEIYMEPGAMTLYENVTQDLSSEKTILVESAASPVTVFPSKEVTVVTAFTVAVPMPESVSLFLSSTKNLTILYQIFDFEKKEIRSGLRTNNLKTSADGQFLLMTTKFFGSFQAVYLKEAVSYDLEKKSSSSEIKSSLDKAVIFKTSPEKKVSAKKSGTSALSFTVSSPSLSENSATVNIVVALAKAAVEDVIINFKFSGTATAGVDYTKSDKLTIFSGSTQAQFILSAVDDNIYEEDESIIIDMNVEKLAMETSTTQKTLTLKDDENKPDLSLSCEQSSFSENAGTSKCTLSLSGPSNKEVTATLAYSGSASSEDYSGQIVNHSISAQTLETDWTVSGLNNSVYAANKTIVIDVDTVTNAQESAVEQKTLTILEDESCVTRPTWFDDTPSNYSCPGSHDACNGSTWEGNLHITCGGGERKCRNTEFTCGAGSCSVSTTGGAHDLYQSSVIYAKDIEVGNSFELNCNASGQRDCNNTHVWCPVTSGTTCECKGACSNVTMHCPLGGADCKVNGTSIAEENKENFSATVYCL